jgi:hypothetical protein
MLTRCIAFATESAEDRYETMTSTSAFADRDEERNANPAGWPATEAPVASERRRWPPPLKASRGALGLSRKKIALGGTVRGPSGAPGRHSPCYECSRFIYD